ncbi:hypothetical protein MLD38_001534 [Melastoma candidum]|uniref:Uncharacterized protein n=1 Tax=Melastoma candidum TaxID=119954 RepID=A0ACB9SCZ4_9MYRT|nr:hypothetical protein MLD38_001534 [Melastoma candidum]
MKQLPKSNVTIPSCNIHVPGGSLGRIVILLTALSVTTLVLATFYWRPSVWQGIQGGGGGRGGCDLFSGEWVHDPYAPYYTNETCWAIHDHQNCAKHGRRDDGYMRWRWKPDGCELPSLSPQGFLDLVRNKSMAFVGDSVGRNQMQSLICLLSRAEYPILIDQSPDLKSIRWNYSMHNFMLAHIWTTHLVRSVELDPVGPTNNGLFGLHLDEPDEGWLTQIEGFDYVIVSSGHWFFRPLIFYERGAVVGCHECSRRDIIPVPNYYGYRMVFRTAFRAINTLRKYRGITFLRTFAPSHFENGTWNTGGDCTRTRPFTREEAVLEGTHMEFYKAQVEEFREAEKKRGSRRGAMRVIDVTKAMAMRPDGHPSRYGHWPHEEVKMPNDCVHWCLPGPVDVWNDLLFHMVNLEQQISSDI